MTALAPQTSANELLDQRELRLGVGAEAVHRDDDVEAEFPGVGDVPFEIGEPSLQRSQILDAERGLGDAAVHLERARGGDDHRDRGLQPRLAALDVEEFLRAEVGAEPGFGDDVIGELQRGARRDEGIAAVRDIGERAAVHQRRIALQRLHEIGAQRLPQQRRHRARRLEIAHRHRLLGARIGDHHAAEARLEIVEAVGETERRHHLGGHGDVEAVGARKTVADAAEADDDFAQARDR